MALTNNVHTAIKAKKAHNHGLKGIVLSLILNTANKKSKIHIIIDIRGTRLIIRNMQTKNRTINIINSPETETKGTGITEN